MKGNTRKFTSFWKGPYTVIDKPGYVTYKIQLIGATQTFVVHRNRLKPCLSPPVPSGTVTTQTTGLSNEYTLPSYTDECSGHVPGVAGYTTVNVEHPQPTATRPTIPHRPTARYNDHVQL